MEPDREFTLDVADTLQPFIDDRQLAGVGAAVLRQGRLTHVALGRRRLDADFQVERDTIFRVASMTKPITTVAALALHDEGRFDLDDPITTCAPEFGAMRVLRHAEGPLDETDAAARPITFRDLLTHRAGLTYAEFHHGPIGRALSDTLGPTIDNPLDPAAWIERLATLPLIDQPGRSFHYGHSTDLLGFLIARLEGLPLGEVLRRRVFAPLGMANSGFAVPIAARHRCAGPCGFDERGRLTALDETPGGHARQQRPDDMTFESGGQGLWSSVDDYLAFARMLIGDPASPALLRAETRALMTSNQLSAEQRAATRLLGQAVFAGGHGYGFGVAVVTDPATADPVRCRGGVGTVGWPGAYGGWWQADPTDGSVAIFLAHNMVDLPQMTNGIGLGVWGAIAAFHGVATS